MNTIVVPLILVLTFLLQGSPPTSYTYLPLVRADSDHALVEVENSPPGLWVHVIQNHPSANVYSRAYIVNPVHPAGLWTPWTQVTGDQWKEYHYRLEWPGGAGQPSYWHEQHRLQFTGADFNIETLPLDQE